jgi:cytidyltransferase-like protein
MNKKVFVSGTFDCIHPGHIKFFKEASKYGDLFVGIGNDRSILLYKGKKPVFNQDERLFMIKSIRFVSGAWVNSGEGQLDWIDNIIELDPDIMIVNEDQDMDAKRRICEHRGIKYVVLKRTPEPGLPARSTTKLREYYENVDNN